MLGFCCCMSFSLVLVSKGYSLVVVCSLIVVNYSIGSEKAMAPHSSTLAWKLPWTEEPGRLQSMGSLRVRHDWATSLSLFTFKHWRRKWQPTPAFLPGESQGRRSLVGCCLQGRTESDTTERLNWTEQNRNRVTDVGEGQGGEFPGMNSEIGINIHSLSRQEYWSGLPFSSPMYIYIKV